MVKSYTSKEQSEMLIKLGIPIESTDMHYLKHSLENFYSPIPFIGKYSKIHDEIPCWSLAALSNFILPYIADDDGNNYKFYLSKDGLDRWIAYYKSDDVSIHICEESDNMIDVIFEMVCWLKKEECI